MSTYLKYRPQTLDQIKGNERVVTTLRYMLQKRETFPHTLLIHGPTGCGKTTLARIIAKELGCVGMDYREVNTAEQRGIDTIRDIINNSQFAPLEGSVRVWVIDESQKLTSEAQHAFLKILEDTPAHVYFIVCTTEPQKLLPTIRGRCSDFQVSTLTEQQMMGLLRRVSKQEGQVLAKEVCDQIPRDSVGLPRNALQILDQVLSVPEEKQLEVARQSAAVVSQTIELCRALIKREKWKEITRILSGLKDEDPESIRRSVLGYCQSVLLKGEDDVAGYIMECFIDPFYDSGFPRLVFACYKIAQT